MKEKMIVVAFTGTGYIIIPSGCFLL